MVPGACIITLIAGTINCVAWYASVFVKDSKKQLIKTKALAYYATIFITAVKNYYISPGFKLTTIQGPVL
jgi:hypothetical protein